MIIGGVDRNIDRVETLVELDESTDYHNILPEEIVYKSRADKLLEKELQKIYSQILYILFDNIKQQQCIILPQYINIIDNHYINNINNPNQFDNNDNNDNNNDDNNDDNNNDDNNNNDNIEIAKKIEYNMAKSAQNLYKQYLFNI